MKFFGKNTVRKTVIGLLVMLVVLPCIAPLSAFAEDDIIYRTWENLTWSINMTTGEMVIGGSGAFPSVAKYVAFYPLDTLIPWYCYRESVKSLVIGDEITSVSSFMFQDFDNLTTVYFGSGVEEIEVPTFDYSDHIENFFVAEDNQYFTAEDGILYTKDKTSILRYPTAREGVFSIPETVTVIENRAFFQCFHLTDVVIPDGVTYISTCAFCDCDGLTSLVIPDSVTKLDAHTFAFCDNIKELYISKNLKIIPAYCFYKLTSLTELVLPRELYQIKSNGFAGCTSLTSVVMFNKVRQVHLPFEDCDNLTDIYYIGTEADTQNLNIRPDSFFYPYNLHYGISGTLPNGIEWELESNEKTLTLTGSGALDGSESIWSDYGEFFNCVYVSDGITGIEACIGSAYEKFGTETVNGVKYNVYAGKYTVSYDANGGTGAPESQSKMHGKSMTLSSQKPQRDGYVFLGWSTDKHASAPSYQSGDPFDIDADTVLYAVWDTVRLTGISLVSPPDKTLYLPGEELDTSGMVILLKYNDGTTKTVSDGFSVSGYDPNVTGSQTVTVKYGGKTTTFAVTVIDETVTVTQIIPVVTKTEYTVGEAFDTASLSLELVFSDGTTQTVTTGFELEGYQSDAAGEQVLTVTYGELAEQFIITVKEKDTVPEESTIPETEVPETEEPSSPNSEIPTEESQTSREEETENPGEKSPASKILPMIAAILAVAAAAISVTVIIVKRKKA